MKRVLQESITTFIRSLHGRSFMPMPWYFPVQGIKQSLNFVLTRMQSREDDILDIALACFSSIRFTRRATIHIMLMWIHNEDTSGRTSTCGNRRTGTLSAFLIRLSLCLPGTSFRWTMEDLSARLTSELGSSIYLNHTVLPA